MDRPRLSLTIATRNRAARLTETLASLLPGLPGGVEVVVADGASTDATPEVAAGLARSTPAFRYHRLEENGGLDRDYARAVELARGEFCWLLPDDDLLVPGAVQRVLAHLDDSLDLLVVNAQIRDGEVEEVLRDRKAPVFEDRRYAPDEWDRLFRDAAELLSYIGSAVIRRALWLEREREPYFGTDFIHLGVIFQRPLARDALFLAEPLVRIRYGAPTWAARAFEIWFCKWPRLLWSFGGLSEETRAAVWPREPWNDLKLLLFAKARGHYSPEEYRRFLRDVKFRGARRLGAWLLAHFPDRLFNRLARLAVPRLRPGDRMLLHELRSSRFGAA